MAIYLKIDGIDGECKKEKHEGWIECLSFNWGANQQSNIGYGTGMSAGTVTFQDVSLTCVGGGKSSLLLLHFLTKGKHLGKITMEFTKAIGDVPEEVWMKIESESSFISSYNVSAQGGEYGTGEIPTDQISLSLANYMQEIWSQETADGALTSAGSFGFDMEKKAVK